MNDLDDLAKKYGTDKQSKPGGHGYTEYYFKHFSSIKNEKLKILEIGVHKGASLNMWADFFSNSQIYGIDDGSSGDLCKEYENHRIHFREGNQTNNEFLSKLVNEVESFDIIFDDGSHYSSDIIHTFKYLFRSNALKSLGWYVIEDLQCSYPPYTNEPLNMR